MNKLTNNKKPLTNQIVIMALLTALIIILARILAINTPILRLSFEFIPISFIGILFGPLWGAVLVAVADLIGSLMLPTGPYNPMFTISAFLTGGIYGLFLHKKEVTIKRTICPVLLVSLLIHLTLNTYWLSIMFDSAFIALLPARLIKTILLPIIEIPLIVFLWNRLKVVLR